MDIRLKVKVRPGVLCRPVVCLLENEVIVKRDSSPIDLEIIKQIRSEGERVIAIIFEIVENPTPQKAIRPIGEYIKEVPEELKGTSLLTTHWNHIRAIMVHQEMEGQDLEEVCSAYYQTIKEVSFNQEFTKGWLMNTVTTAEVTQELKAG